MCQPHSSLAIHPTHADLTDWVPGWAFRQHLAHLGETTGLGWRVVAAATGLGVGAARRLLRCRPRAGRIPASQAATLLDWRATDLLQRADQPVPCEHASVMAQWLVTNGWTPARVAGAVVMPRPDLHALLEGRPGRSRRVDEWRLVALLEAHGLVCPVLAQHEALELAAA